MFGLVDDLVDMFQLLAVAEIVEENEEKGEKHELEQFGK
jgi:hypothetical protein